ncbi:EAL domain-containing protein [Rhodanobacter sp. B2A1Ga4]|uniref:bifunctional diguanylate cyclase/phosphodiesterase n=1 Tax=Rhodanobacter sp. B2A1Ga4 TaxID=2778647 RepID=UPI001B36B7A8|nr:EAL domain-containing protein [Rhodanobacter sp. B2A1Ga4]MBQ4854992.1 EAL domain-containing protein [Rhodanobacter sp. B2A1Ga4]
MVDPAIPQPPRWHLAAWLWSLLALLLGLLLSLAAHEQQMRRLQAERTLIRNEMASKAYVSLQGRLHAAESLLRAAQSLFLSSEEVDAGEYAGFYANMRPREQFPGLLALAYAQREQRPDGEHYVTRWVEPEPGNERVVGLDVGMQPRNLAGLLASRDDDLATLSAPFHLAQLAEAGMTGEGVTLRLPIYGPGPPPRTVEERRARVRGSIAVSFRLDDLIGNALPDQLTRHLSVRVSDITGPDALPLFDSTPGLLVPPDGYRYESKLTYGGRVWNVVMQPLPHRTGAGAGGWGRATLLAGVVASILLALLAYSVASTRQRALALGWRMSRRYRESEERFRALNELLPALVLLAEAAGGAVTYANQASRDRLGRHATERQLPELFEDPELRAQLQQDDTRGCSRVDALLRNDEGGAFWASVAISRIRLNGRDKLLMVASDISEQRQLTELLSHQASHDALTELYNRREFERRLHDTLAATGAGTPPAVLLYIDLDQFKLINDTSGHLAGDQLLAQLAIVMRKQLGGTDVLARLGGDEFGVLATNVADRDEAERIAERVRRCIDGYIFIWEQRSCTISASIGGVMIDRPGILVKDLLAQADTACYMAKELGRNRVHFFSERDDETVRRHGEMEWANRLRWAVDEHRLVLTYQEIWPLPLAAGGEPDVELLLRFREESGQLVAPGVFMPAAERYGLMPVVDRWVIETTLANFDRLHPSGGALRMVAINLSGASVEDEALAGLIIGLLRRYRVEPSRVCFEITETVAVRNLSQVVRFMEQLRAVGCRIALDDFGAGMSSFTYLKNLPLDIIKIDGSFVRDMLTDPVSHLMVRAVTDIGHRLGLEVVAEWVADAETVQALAALGVNRVQGFSLHRPEPALFQRD